MTAEALAAFCERPVAVPYANVCSHFGIDPAGFIDDDVLAFNLRAGLLVKVNEQAAEQDQSPSENPFAKAEALQEMQWPASS